MAQDRRFIAAATFATISAVLHLIALLLSGFVANLVASLFGALIWAVLAYGLSRHARWVAYPGFLMGLIGFCTAFAIVLAGVPGPLLTVWIGIMIADALAAVTLFMLLWRSRPT